MLPGRGESAERYRSELVPGRKLLETFVERRWRRRREKQIYHGVQHERNKMCLTPVFGGVNDVSSWKWGLDLEARNWLIHIRVSIVNHTTKFCVILDEINFNFRHVESTKQLDEFKSLGLLNWQSIFCHDNYFFLLNHSLIRDSLRTYVWF